MPNTSHRGPSQPLPRFPLSPLVQYLSQGHDEVFIKRPGSRRFTERASASVCSREQWVYAAFSMNVYADPIEWAAEPDNDLILTRNFPYSAPLSKAYEVCKRDYFIPLQGWKKWDFPSDDLRRTMEKESLHAEIHESTSTPRTIVVAFRGTGVLQTRDWKANLRAVTRWLFSDDQYGIVSREVGREFLEQLESRKDEFLIDSDTGKLRDPAGNEIRIVATGHSLGGGLAQHFAYSFPRNPGRPAGPKVDEVFAFNPSPVTGWFSVSKSLRAQNATGLVVHRIFERGEILAALRKIARWLTPSSRHPDIWEYRYRFLSRWKFWLANSLSRHGMRLLARGLVVSAFEGAAAPVRMIRNSANSGTETRKIPESLDLA